MALLCAVAVRHAAAITAPANDNWANRTVIAALPYSTSTNNMYLASSEATDPQPECRTIGGNAEGYTLWYSYTTGASTEYVTLSITDNQIVGAITVYTGTPGAFTIVTGACGAYSSTVGKTRIAGLRLAPNTTYSIKVGATYAPNDTNTLNFSVTAATQYLVTKTADTNDGTCDSDCSLREAIGASNANPGAVLIPAGTYTLAIGGATEDDNNSGDLDARSGMGIYGAGMTQTIIDANHIDRVLQLDSHGDGSATFAVGDLTLQNGNASVAGPNLRDQWGGGLLLSALYGLGLDYVGLERVAVLSNYAYQPGGGLDIEAPGTIRDSVVANNTAAQNGGGGLSFLLDPSRDLEVSGSTFSGNAANGSGNGGGIVAQGSLLLSNSTVSGNRSAYYGGGIATQGNSRLTMASSTVVFNGALLDNAFATGVGGGVHLDSYNGSTSSIVDSIIADNAVGNPSDEPDCGLANAALTSSYNLVPFPNNCAFTGSGDVTGVDAGVSTALAYNGGLTPTHALTTGSPALDTGDPAGCKDAHGLTLATDQRGTGFPRVVGAACDKGALESPTVTPPGAPVMDAASDSGASNSDAITSNTQPGFTGACSDGTQIQLQVDGTDVAPNVACSSGAYAITVSAAIAEGTHAVTATATASAVTSLQSPPLAVDIDTTPPTPSITAYPPNPDSNTNPSFSFSAEAGSSYECSLDAGGYAACTSPSGVGVGLGPHTFAVTATDLAGNFNPVPAQYSWTVLPPTPSAPALDPASDSGLSNSDAITNAVTPVFTGACTDGDSMQLVESAQPLGDPAICSGGAYSIGVALAEAGHAIQVTATRSGYTSTESAALDVTIDRTPPQAPTITAPVGLASPNATIGGTATENDGLITVKESATTVCTANGPFVSGNWSCQASFGSSGTHDLTATQTDVAGNVSAPSAVFPISVDLVFRNGFE